MSNYRKGLRTKNKARNYYETQGWMVDDCEKTGKFIKKKDLFDLFDLVAIRDGVVNFIQVKTNNPAKVSTYRDWAKEHCNSNIKCEVFTWYDYEGPKIQDYKEDGSIVELDLRKESNEGKSLWKDKLSKTFKHKKQRIR